MDDQRKLIQTNQGRIQRNRPRMTMNLPFLSSTFFNEQIIHKITITSHYKLEHDDVMTNEKILEIVKKLNGEIIKPEPKKKPAWPDVFVPKGIEYQSKKHLLVL